MGWKYLLQELDKLNLPKDKYAITSSGCLAIRGLREANDIDVILTDDLFEQLSKKHKVIKLEFDGYKIGLNKNVEAVGRYKNKPFTEELIKEADIFEGRRYVSLKWVRFFKKKWNRVKDGKDIKLIDKYFADNRK